MPPTQPDQRLRAVAVAAIAAVNGQVGRGAGWAIAEGEFWCQVEVRGAADSRRLQGWKIHLSATPDNAVEVLHRALPILLEEQCAFKFVRSLDDLRQSLSRGFPREAAGKFITVYPGDDERFAALAELLHHATVDLHGPQILSDRRYAPGSLVHYRFGGFAPLRDLADSGYWRDMLVTPEGYLTPDRRVPWFTPPTWAKDPIAGRVAAAGESRAAHEASPQVGRSGASDGGPRKAAPLLAGRYAVSRAIRHTSRGGIYRGVDTADGSAVVIKQARPFADAGGLAGDAQGLLRNEASMLRRLEGTGLTARLVDSFSVGADLFVVLNEIDGTDLDKWVLSETSRGRSLSLRDSLDCCLRLIRLMGEVHGLGVVLNDFSPGNVLRHPDGTLWLLDLEGAAAEGATTSALMTLAFAAPERLQAYQDRVRSPASTAADRYSLGATICFLALEQHPFLLPDETDVGRPYESRLARWLEVAAEAGMPLAARVAPLVSGLMAADPGRRWTLSRAEEFVASLSSRGRRGGAPAVLPLGGAPGTAGAPDHADDVGARSDLEPLIRGSVAYLIRSQRPERETLWPIDNHLEGIEPSVVAHGAAGIAAVLARAWQHRHLLCSGSPRIRSQRPADEDGSSTRGSAGAVPGGTQPLVTIDTLTACVAAANRWNDGVLSRSGRQVLPGLYAGHAGIAWAAYDVATVVQDEVNQRRACALARSLPTSWRIPDVFHGTAGAGMALLQLWQATGDEQLGEKVRACADSLITVANRQSGAVSWPVAPDQQNAHGIAETSRAYHGFAHGTAGIGMFLLLAGAACSDTTYLEVAAEAGNSLARAGRREWDERDGGETAWWTVGEETAGEPDGGWCQGAAGVGSFLLALWKATGDSRYRGLAEGAGLAAYRSSRHAAGGACHGVAGIGHFLLDLASSLGEPGWAAKAEDVARWLAARAIQTSVGPAFAGSDAFAALSLSAADGMAGDLDFALRLQYGGPSPWQVAQAPAGHARPRSPKGEN